MDALYPRDVLKQEHNGTVNVRSSLEARVQWMELEAIRYGIDWDRQKATAILTEALTGNPLTAEIESDDDQDEENEVSFKISQGLEQAQKLPFFHRGGLSHSVGNYTDGYSRMLRASQGSMFCVDDQSTVLL